ncbi:MAG: ABC-F family ATP-binding cassette domain-containing protein, partial [Clostridiales bacterium]|nr:ABC-F family ATP-binding cassette domain-containing protein [Clostridiales bacterium]
DRIKRDMVEPEKEEQSIRFALKAQEGGGNDILIAERLKKSFAAPLFDNVSLHIRKDEKVFLLGANGCGKTTLLKILQGAASADSGTVRRGVGVMPGYYDQTQSGLHPDKTALDEIWDSFPRMTETEVRSALAVFLFQGDAVYKQVALLSGGEKARLLLLKLMLSKANFLILDEPTNHLDIGSREALEDALLGYGGTLLMVSHDRYFINKLADRILVLTLDGVEEYIGGYDEYAEKAARAVPVVQKTAPKQKKPNEYQLKKEAASQQRRLAGRISRLEQEIEGQELLIERLQEQIEDPQTAANYQKLLELTEQLEQARKSLEEQYELWGELEEERNQAAAIL